MWIASERDFYLLVAGQRQVERRELVGIQVVPVELIVEIHCRIVKAGHQRAGKLIAIAPEHGQELVVCGSDRSVALYVQRLLSHFADHLLLFLKVAKLLQLSEAGGGLFVGICDDLGFPRERRVAGRAMVAFAGLKGKNCREETRAIESYNSTLVEPRRFSVEEPGRQIVIHEVALWEPSGGGRAAWAAMLPRETDWRGRRELKEKMKQLIESRRFLQYGQGTAHAQAEQMRALQDLRALIRTVNQGAVYLWDPYLSANDILNTLTFCTDTGTELRALTSTKGASLHETGAQTRQADGVPDMSDDIKRQKWIEAQHRTLETAFETPARMHLEYRLSSTEKGSFHDRFLIFPGLGRDRTRAWSLGASINHIGAQHCIVQEVAYPEPVQQAFEDFWQQSLDEEFLVWKYK